MIIYESCQKRFHHTPKVGNIYPAKGGASYKRSTQKWIVISIVGDAEKDLASAKAVMLGLDEHDNIVSSQTHNCIALYDRKVLGWVNVSELRISE